MKAEELKILRKKNNLTQKELAEKLGTKDTVISRWENGRSNISSAYAKLILLTLK